MLNERSIMTNNVYIVGRSIYTVQKQTYNQHVQVCFHLVCKDWSCVLWAALY